MLDDARPRVFDPQIEAHVAMVSQLNATSATLHVAAKSTHVVVRVPTHAIQYIRITIYTSAQVVNSECIVLERLCGARHVPRKHRVHPCVFVKLWWLS